MPEIFNADQGSQFTSEEFTGVLKQHGIQISMDGKGRWVGNVFVERLWRSVKYEEAYLKAYESIGDARESLGRYFTFYNSKRRHPSLDRQTPDSVYYQDAAREAAQPENALIVLPNLRGPPLTSTQTRNRARYHQYCSAIIIVPSQGDYTADIIRYFANRATLVLWR